MSVAAPHAAATTWGLPDRRNKVDPPKVFNIASRVQKTSIEQPLTCRVHPVAILKILDAYVRRPEDANRTIGTLLGWISEGSVVDITESFPVVHKDEKDQTLMDQDYHKQMLQMKQKVSPREVVVGWFSTGDEINTSSAMIHSYYSTKDSQFTPSAVLPGPIHMLLDTSVGTAQQAFNIKAYVNVKTTVAENLLQFHEVPLRVQTSPAEKAGISQLMHARRATREATNTDQIPKDIATMDGFEGGLKELLSLFRRMQEYVKAVVAGKAQGDLAVGRGLTAALCAEPIIDIEAVEQLCNSSMQDALMVVYLSNLTRTQISIAEKINAQYGIGTDGM
jgi:translation initiation factor 3 subunit F